MTSGGFYTNPSNVLPMTTRGLYLMLVGPIRVGGNWAQVQENVA